MQCVAAVEREFPGSRNKLIAALFEKQENFTTASTKNLTRGQILQIFEGIAGETDGVLDGEDGRSFKSTFAEKCSNWEDAVMPAWAEQKKALGHGVTSAPSHVIDGRLVADTDSTETVKEWEAVLPTLCPNSRRACILP
jgi:hypothetical protein